MDAWMPGEALTWPEEAWRALGAAGGRLRRLEFGRESAWQLDTWSEGPPSIVVGPGAALVPGLRELVLRGAVQHLGDLSQVRGTCS